MSEGVISMGCGGAGSQARPLYSTPACAEPHGLAASQKELPSSSSGPRQIPLATRLCDSVRVSCSGEEGVRAASALEMGEIGECSRQRGQGCIARPWRRGSRHAGCGIAFGQGALAQAPHPPTWHSAHCGQHHHRHWPSFPPNTALSCLPALRTRPPGTARTAGSTTTGLSRREQSRGCQTPHAGQCGAWSARARPRRRLHG